MVFITIRKLKLTCLKCSGVVKKKFSQCKFRGPEIKCLVPSVGHEGADLHAGISHVVNSYVQVQFQDAVSLGFSPVLSSTTFHSNRNACTSQQGSH